MQLIKYTTVGLRIPGYGAAEVFIDFTEELRHAETNPTCEIHESHCTSHRRRQSVEAGQKCIKIRGAGKSNILLTLNRCLPASVLKPEEREFVVDSGASMLMISRKGLESC